MENINYRWAAEAAHLLANSPSLVAIVGGGGKTTMLYALGRYLQNRGAKVLLSTTAQMLPPQKKEALLWLSPTSPPPVCRDHLYLWGAAINHLGKVVGVRRDLLAPHLSTYDYILVEADGSRGLPLKFWGADEPVLPQGVTDVLCIASDAAVGKPVEEVLHRWQLAQQTIAMPPVVDEHLWHGLRRYQHFFLQKIAPAGTKIMMIDRRSSAEQFPVPSIAALVLAAGAGSRFGGGKLTEILHGKPVISWLLRMLNGTALYPKTVVGGSDERVRHEAENYYFQYCKNEQWAEGMGSSLRVGINHILKFSGRLQGVLVFLGDMPAVKRETVLLMCASVMERNPDVAYPVYNGQRGHPVYFSRACFSELLKLTGDAGGRAILNELPNQLPIEVDDEGVILDIDQRDDLKLMTEVIDRIENAE